MVKVESMNISLYRTTSSMLLMQGDIKWRGALEKDAMSLQFLIERLMKHGDVVLDAYAFKGAIWSFQRI